MRSFVVLEVMALGWCVLSASASAQTPALTEQQRIALFQAADTNRNGLLEKSEWLATLSSPVRVNADVIWLRLDPGGAGFVSQDTFVTANGRLPATKNQ